VIFHSTIVAVVAKKDVLEILLSPDLQMLSRNEKI